MRPQVERAAEQRDAADEGRLEACGDAMVGTVIVIEGKVVRPSQLIASVLRTIVGTRGGEPVSKVVGFGGTSCCLSRPS